MVARTFGANVESQNNFVSRLGPNVSPRITIAIKMILYMLERENRVFLNEHGILAPTCAVLKVDRKVKVRFRVRDDPARRMVIAARLVKVNPPLIV